MKFGTAGLNIMPFNSNELRENRGSESQALHRVINEFFIRFLLISFSTRIKFSTRDLHIILSSILDFCRSWLVEHRSFPMGMN